MVSPPVFVYGMDILTISTAHFSGAIP